MPSRPHSSVETLSRMVHQYFNASAMTYFVAIIAFSQDLVLTLEQNPFGSLSLIFLLFALGYCAKAIKGARKSSSKK